MDKEPFVKQLLFYSVHTRYNPAALYVGTGGDVEVITLNGDTVVFHNVPTGTFMPIQVTRVKAANTTASDIIALF